MQQRRVDTPGEISDPQAKDKDEAGTVAPLTVELSLWKSGRVKFSSNSQKASLAVVAMIVLLVLIVLLSLFESLPGLHPGVSASLDPQKTAVISQRGMGESLGMSGGEGLP